MKAHSSIAVFDSGIGSYSLVNSIQQTAPNQNIIYFADRKSFPYGSKTPDELFKVVSRAIHFLEAFRPTAIVMASNVPSVTILSRLQSISTIPIYGIFPPIREAIQLSHSKKIGVLAVQSLASHPAIHAYIASQTDLPEQVHVMNASSLVEKVESGEFLFDIEATESAVRSCIDRCLNECTSIDTFTLSSTHLPWLVPYLERLYPQYDFVDPATSIIASLPLKNDGVGSIRGLATEGELPIYSKENFHKMMTALGIYINMEWVHIGD